MSKRNERSTDAPNSIAAQHHQDHSLLNKQTKKSRFFMAGIIHISTRCLLAYCLSLPSRTQAPCEKALISVSHHYVPSLEQN